MMRWLQTVWNTWFPNVNEIGKRLFIVKNIPHLKGCLFQNTMVHYGVVHAQKYIKGTHPEYFHVLNSIMPRNYLCCVYFTIVMKHSIFEVKNGVFFVYYTHRQHSPSLQSFQRVAILRWVVVCWKYKFQTFRPLRFRDLRAAAVSLYTPPSPQ